MPLKTGRKFKLFGTEYFKQWNGSKMCFQKNVYKFRMNWLA